MPNTRLPHPYRRAMTAALIVALGCAMKQSVAFGLDEMYSPNVEYRELALEYNGSRSFDPRPTVGGAQTGEVTLEAGLTPRLAMEINSQYSREPGNALQLFAHEIEARYQFVESGEYWLDAGVLVAYDFPTRSNSPSSLEVKLLLQKDVGRFTHTANIGFTQNVGKYSGNNGGADYLFIWNTRYRYSTYFQPGIEIQSDLGQGSPLGHANEQEHYIGPTVSGKLFGHVKYQAAYFVGVTSAAARNAARFLVEYETHF